MSEGFSQAVTFISSASIDTDNTTKLELYSLFKYISVSTSGPASGRPSIFDFAGRAKWDAWKNASQNYKSREEAETRYKEIAASLGWKQGEKAEASPPQMTTPSGMGFSVSTLSQSTEELDDSLHGITLGNNVEAMRKILEEGVELNARDEYDYTALHLAADRGHYNIVELLLKAGADPALKDPDGFTAQQLAEEAGHVQISSLFQSHHAG